LLERGNMESLTVSKEGEEKQVGNAGIAIGSVVSAACAGAVIFMAHAAKKSEFYPFMVYVLQTMQQTPYMDFLLNGAFIVSLALFASSALLSCSAVLERRALTKVGILLVFVSSGFMVAGGAISLNYIGDLDGNVNNDAQPASSGPAREVQDFSISMYNRCCLSQNYVNASTAKDLWLGRLEAADMDDATSKVQTCAELANAKLDKTKAADLLKPCIGSPAHVQWFDIATTDWLCEQMNNTLVNIDGFVLRGIPLVTLTLGAPEVEVAGFAASKIYGCGGGKIKAFQFLIYIWFQNTCKPVALSLLICGIVSLLACFFAVASLSLGGAAEDNARVDMATLEAYMNRQSRRLSYRANGSNREEAPMEVQTAQPLRQSAGLVKVQQVSDERVQGLI
jgi:hypothetical protein